MTNQIKGKQDDAADMNKTRRERVNHRGACERREKKKQEEANSSSSSRRDLELFGVLKERLLLFYGPAE